MYCRHDTNLRKPAQTQNEAKAVTWLKWTASLVWMYWLRNKDYFGFGHLLC